MEDQMNQPGAVQPAPQKPKRPAKSQRKGGRLYTIEEANTFAASMCAIFKKASVQQVERLLERAELRREHPFLLTQIS